MASALRALSGVECRVLGVLVEKQLTVPDTYPLSLNALTAGCNQKTARHPVLELSDAQVIEALDELKRQSLVNESSGGRVSRYEHNMQRVLGVPSQSVAVLAALMLRGPQTAAELRLNTERLHRFADVSSVEGFLDELSERDLPLVVRLARAPGMRENRWAHLLGGPPAEPVAPLHEAAAAPARVDELSLLRSEVAELRRQIQHLYSELGVRPADHPDTQGPA